MANRDEVKGFQPYGRVTQSIVKQAGGTIYEGDLLKLKDDGTVVAAAATNPSCGVALNYAVSGEKVLIASDPSQLFIGQCDGADVDAQTDINLNADAVMGSANTTYRRSGMEIDSSSIDTTATLQLKIIEVLPRADNALGEFCKCVVKINNHQFGSHTGTAGV